MYNPSVATIETTMLRKMEFVKKSPTVRVPFALLAAMSLIPLIARNHAAN